MAILPGQPGEFPNIGQTVLAIPDDVLKVIRFHAPFSLGVITTDEVDADGDDRWVNAIVPRLTWGTHEDERRVLDVVIALLNAFAKGNT